MPRQIVTRCLIVVLICFVAFTCREEKIQARNYPSIDTKDVTEIDPNGATLNGKILDTGNSGIADYGFIYDEFTDPKAGTAQKISLGKEAQNGDFSVLANRGLIKDRKYNVWSYAITVTGNITVFGKPVSFISQGGAKAEIKGFFPKEGSIGDTIRIIGKAFGTSASNNHLTFAGIPATIIKTRIDTLWCIVPTQTPPGDGLIALTVGQYTANAVEKFNLAHIIISSFSPTSVTFGDTLTINGNNFPRDKKLFVVSILGKNATIVSNTKTKIKAIVPADDVITPYPIILRAGLQSTSPTTNTQLLLPLITSFSPVKGTKDTEVTITGNYFHPVASKNHVELNGQSLTISAASKTMLKVKIPTGITPGAYPFSITIAGQTILAIPTFEIVKPVINSFSPANGTWGNTITITGENFGTTPSDNLVKFNGVQATVTSASPTQLMITVPNGLLTRNSIITVQAISTDNLIATAANSFTLNATTLTSFSPQQGKSNTFVTITGSNFNPVPANQVVKFGAFITTVVSATATELVLRLPTSLIDSDVTIAITLAEQEITSSQTFHLISPWRRVADYPPFAREGSVSFVIGNSGYVTLGTQNIPTTDKPTYRYDPSSDSWTQVKSFNYANEGNTADYTGQVAFGINGNGYVGGGFVSGANKAKMMKYSPATDDWIQIASLPTILNEGLGFGINGKGYVTTGSIGGNAIGPMFVYDPIIDSWSIKTSLPASGRWKASGFAIDDKLYVVSGLPCPTCSTYLNDAWEYNTVNDTWRRISDFPGAKIEGTSGFALAGVGYLINNGGFWKYDPVTNAWSQLEDFPGVKRFRAYAFTINGKSYYGTGFGMGADTKDMWEFDPSKL